MYLLCLSRYHLLERLFHLRDLHQKTNPELRMLNKMMSKNLSNEFIFNETNNQKLPLLIQRIKTAKSDSFIATALENLLEKTQLLNS